MGRAAGESLRSIGRRLGRHASTVMREIRPDEKYGQRYRASQGEYRSFMRAWRPKTARLATHGPLRDHVLAKLRLQDIFVVGNTLAFDLFACRICACECKNRH